MITINGLILSDEDGFTLTFPANKTGDPAAWAKRLMDRLNSATDDNGTATPITLRAAVAEAHGRNAGIPLDTSEGVWGPKVNNTLVDIARQRSADAEAAGLRTNIGSLDSISLLKQRWGICQQALPLALKDPVKGMVISALLPQVSVAFFKGAQDRSHQVETSAAIDQVQILMEALGIKFLAKDLRGTATGPTLPNAAAAPAVTAEQLAAVIGGETTETEDLTVPVEDGNVPSGDDDVPTDGHDPNGL